VTTSLAVVDFLNSREKAVILWTVVILAYAALGGGVRSGFADVLGTLFHWKLLLLFGTAAAYCTGVVYLALRVGLWHQAALKDTVYWFVTGGVVLVGDAVTHAAPGDERFFRRLLRQAVRFAVLVAFLVNLYVFPFLAELALVPLILILVVGQVAAESDASLAQARKPIGRTLMVIGAFLLAYVAIKAAKDPGSLFTRENLESLLTPAALTFAFVPFLWACAWLSRREQEHLRKRWKNPPPVGA
jgi:hypothetical protein